MPPKRTNNKKKNKQQGKENASHRDIANWVEKGRMDAKGLSKSLPGVAEAIREGSLKPSEVPKMVETANKNSLLEQMSKALPDTVKTCQFIEMDSIRVHFPNADPILRDLVKVACGGNDPLRLAFAKDFFGSKNWGNFAEVLLKMEKNVFGLTRDEVLLFPDVHEAYDKTCEKYKTEIEKYMKRPLKEACFAYGQSMDEFVQVCFGLNDRRESYGIEQFAEDFAFTQTIEKGLDKKVEASARGVEAGWDTERKKCWECGQVATEIQKCSRCQAARYCSVTCQRTAWKDGHRGACSSLKTKYQRFTENYKRIDHALALQEEEHPNPMCQGCTLAPAGAKDYEMVPLMLRIKEAFVLQPCLSDDTSIDHMYKSLADILKGHQHWMFDDVFTGTLQELLHTNAIEFESDDELEYMKFGMLFLGNDLSKVTPASALDEWVHAMKDHLRKILKGELMSVHRFIMIYYRFGLAHREGNEDPSARLENLAKGLYMLMNFAHKSTTVKSDDEFQKTMESFNSR